MQRFDGAEAWRNLDPLVRDRIGAIALELVMAWWVTDRSVDTDSCNWRNPVAGRAAEHAGGYLSELLEVAVVTALPPELIGPGAPLAVPSLIGPVCRFCGCSDNDACKAAPAEKSAPAEAGGACHWVEPDLCSRCRGRSGASLAERSGAPT